MDRKKYCDRVLAQVGRLTSDEANDLRNELAGHIEDHAEALVEHGYTEEDAAARAVELMGDPEETGRALREQYRHFWLVIVQRIAIFVTIVACVQGFFMLLMLGGVYESIRERVSPAVNSISWEELDGAADLHERILVGDDIVQLNRIEYGVREGERQAVLWVSSYDRIPGRKVYERLIETMSLQSERGETMYGEDSIRYSSCWGSSGSLYVHSGQHTVPLEEGDTYVTSSTTASASASRRGSSFRKGERSHEKAEDRKAADESAPRGQERCHHALRAAHLQYAQRRTPDARHGSARWRTALRRV